MNRGRRREEIFYSPADYRLFLGVLREASESWKIHIAAYCLMPNHYHLLVTTPEGNIARCMRHINGVYTQRFNRRHKIDGQLFRGRYKALLVDKDNYLLEVLRYIHRNPLRAGLVNDLNSYEWCSHKGYLSQARKWRWLYKRELLNMLSGDETLQTAAYAEFIAQGEPEEIREVYTRRNLPAILGNGAFKEWVKETFAQLRLKPEVPDSQALAFSPEQIIALVCDYFKISKEQLSVSRRGKENVQRDLALYLIRQNTGKTLAEIGSYFGIVKYSTVSSAVERIKSRLAKDKKCQKNLLALTEKLNNSQRET